MLDELEGKYDELDEEYKDLKEEYRKQEKKLALAEKEEGEIRIQFRSLIKQKEI